MAKRTECKFCKGKEDCPAKSTGKLKFLCTREKGHTGEHVACAKHFGEHKIHTWK